MDSKVSCVDNCDLADDGSEVGVVSAHDRRSVGKNNAKGFVHGWVGRPKARTVAGFVTEILAPLSATQY